MSIATTLLRRARARPNYELPVAGTDALARAAANFAANRDALEIAWPPAALALPDVLPEMEWLYARDGALSCRHVDRRWFGDLSVPRRAAERMLATLEVGGSTAVLIAPTHARLIRAALDRMNDRQALIVVLPGEYDAGVMLACENFSSEIRTGRLWPIVGPDWERELDALLGEQVGLAPAATMIRVPGLNEAVVERLLRPVEAMLTKHHQSHRQHLALLHARPATPASPARRACVLAPRWRLWADEGAILTSAVAKARTACATPDTSRPDRSSALSLARQAEGCDAIVAANLGRADLPLVVPDAVPWVTLATTGRVPARSAANGRDRLVAVDAAIRDRALAAGWPATHVDVVDAARPAPPTAGVRPAIVFDLPTPAKPTAIAEMSSHGLVWDRVVAIVEDAKHVATRSASDLIAGCGEALGIAANDLPVESIRSGALVPTFARTLALRLHAAGVTFDVYGSGWDAVPELATRWRGPIGDEAAFDAMLSTATAIVDVWPGAIAPAARRSGRPTLPAWGRTDAQLAADLRATPRRAMASTPFDLDAILARL